MLVPSDEVNRQAPTGSQHTSLWVVELLDSNEEVAMTDSDQGTTQGVMPDKETARPLPDWRMTGTSKQKCQGVQAGNGPVPGANLRERCEKSRKRALGIPSDKCLPKYLPSAIMGGKIQPLAGTTSDESDSENQKVVSIEDL